MIILLHIAIWVTAAALTTIGLSLVTHDLRWAVSVPRALLPSAILKPHDDWWIFKFVGRSWTAFGNWPEPWQPPVKLFGTAPRQGHLDIVPARTWVLAWPVYLTIRWSEDRQSRIGLRPDYNDGGYYTVAFSPWDRVS